MRSSNLLSVTVALSTLLMSSAAVAGKSPQSLSSRWYKSIGLETVPDETATDVFPPDLSGKWSVFCSVFKKPGIELKFDTVNDRYSVLEGKHRCKLITVTDYRKMDMYYFVRNIHDCTLGSPKFLVANYSFSYIDNSLLARNPDGPVKFINCAKGLK
jgi:hypothetical protein